MTEEKIELFLKAIEDHFKHFDPRTNWPLNGAQIDSYFDASEALDIYHRITTLKKTKTTKEIAELLPPADMIRLFVSHNAFVGLKSAYLNDIEKIDFHQRLEYANILFDIIKEKTNGDPFCLDGKNLILSNTQINDLVKGTVFSKPENTTDQKQIANIIVTMNHYCYALYYDVFMSAGFYIHGPYDMSSTFGENTILIVREYHNLKPGIWPEEHSPYKTMQMFCVYKSLDYKIDFENSQRANSTIPDKLIAYAVFADGKRIDKNKFEEIEELFDNLSAKQSAHVDSLSDIDKIKKGAGICYHFFDKLRTNTGENPNPVDWVNETYNKFGDKFIVQFARKEKPSVNHWKQLFDPRNNYL